MQYIIAVRPRRSKNIGGPDKLFNRQSGKGAEPARLFVHGLTGSGKTQVMLWPADYFQQVWRWTKGVQFIYLAPLNSMAARIGGFTVHSWGEVPWIKESPIGSVTMGSGQADLRNMSSMAAKSEVARWLFIDEAEAVGAENFGILEEHTAETARTRLYKYRGGCENSQGSTSFRRYECVSSSVTKAASTCASSQYLQ